MGEDDGNGLVKQKVGNQEWQGAGQQRWLVILGPPGSSNAKGENKTQHVEKAPGAEPGNAQNCRVEQQVITK